MDAARWTRGSGGGERGSSQDHVDSAKNREMISGRKVRAVTKGGKESWEGRRGTETGVIV